MIPQSYDAACHLAEEMPRPARDVPIAMVGSVAVNGILGLGYCIMLLYSLGDLDECKKFLLSSDNHKYSNETNFDVQNTLNKKDC